MSTKPSHPTWQDRLWPGFRLVPWLLLSTVVGALWNAWVESQGWGLPDRWATLGDRVLLSLFCAVVTATGLRALTLFVWEPYRQRRHLRKLPSLMKQGGQLLVSTLVFFWVLGTVWQISITGLLAATGVVGIVVGLALKELISDLFSGAIITLDKTVKIGDFLRIENRNFQEKRGTVVEMNWRTVRLVTPENTLVVLPNTFVANNVITNLSEPADAKEFEITLTFDHEIPSERVIRILDAALAATPEVPLEPVPKVRLHRVSESGVDYKVLYYLPANGPEPGKVRHFLLIHLLHHLAQAGVSPSYPKQDVYTSPLPQRNLDPRAHRADLLRRIPLFSDLDDASLAQLAAGVVERRAPRGVSLVQAGDRGASLFLLVEGLLEVVLPGGGRDELPPGSYFGEMSLMTGEPRSATVRAARDSVAFEVPQETMDHLLRSNPALVDEFSRKIADLEAKHALTAESSPSPEPDRARRLRDRIGTFFRLW